MTDPSLLISCVLFAAVVIGLALRLAHFFRGLAAARRLDEAQEARRP